MGVPDIDWRGLNLDIKQGGSTMEYHEGDPHTRKMFQEQSLKEGAELNMPEEVYLRSTPGLVEQYPVNRCVDFFHSEKQSHS